MKKEKTIKNFINVLEIVYSLFLAVGLSNLLFKFEFTATYISLLFICVLVITRFFFAPSKNIEDLLNKINEKGEKYKYRDHQFNVVMWFDVPILFIHAIIFSIMCSFVAKGEYITYFASFFFLLIVNSFWLFIVEYRIRDGKESNYPAKKFWAFNNLVYACIIVFVLFLANINYFSLYLFNINIVFYILFILGLSNCLIDLMTQYKTYLFHDKGETTFNV